MTAINRRGLRLASALLASGLALSAAPAVAQADDSELLTLTDAQADELTHRIMPDIYGDGRSLDPRQAVEDTADGATTTDDSSTTATPAWKLNKKSAVEGAQGMAATYPVGGTGGDYFTVNGLLPIKRFGADGKELWSRDSTSLHEDWGIKPLRVYQPEPYPAAVVMGFNAVSPFSTASDQGVTTGDLTGDGVDDVVFTAEVGVYPYRPFTSPGSSLPNGTFVTVLDGATGKTLWSKLFAAAYNVKLVGKTLVVADSAYYNLNSPAGSKATLTGIRFGYADGKLTPSQSWTYDAGTYTGVLWGALEPIGGGLLAASWNQDRNATASLTPSGHTLVIDTADGSLKWAKTGRNYVRQLHLDAARGRIVALEQSDYREGMKYEITSYAPADGTRTSLTTRINALPLALEIGDLQGDTKPEYTVSESTVDGVFMSSNSVRALNGDDASLLWARTVKRPRNEGDVGAAWGIQVVDGKVVASYMDDNDTTNAGNRGSIHYARLSVLAGNNGAVKWEKRGIVGSMLGTQPYLKDRGWRVRTVDTNQNVLSYNLGSGKRESLLPLEGIPYTATATDINGDKKQDLVVGGSSNGVFAYDGPSLVAGQPKRLWSAVLPGRVVQVVKADTTGDGRDEIVVAASSAAAVVDARTGKVLSVMEAPAGEYVRNVVASDLDGDGAAEVAVGTDKLRAYEGDGTLKWEYTVPAEIGTPAFADLSAADGKVYAEFQTRGVNPGAGGVPVGGVAVNGKDGSVAWSFTPQAPAGTTGVVLGIVPRAATFASPGIPYADGHAVVYTQIVRTDASKFPPNTLVNLVQIRDGRTGELLHEVKVGGYATLANWSTGPEGLVEGALAGLRSYGPNGEDRLLNSPSDIRSSSFATGPDGARVLVATGTQFATLFDPAVLTAGVNYPRPVTEYFAGGAREHFVADLDGDGKDEVLLLTFDDYGADLTAGLVGNVVSQPYTAIRSLITLSIDKP
ncbi:hypothetical protein AB0M28_36505 [Streptomyces sp. NPDC051940]|uniref:hypothetical protein n=1 Tax=Streptomyces sp. NPDC051940 TaxID=3155675 RepID=UPI0034407B79